MVAPVEFTIAVLPGDGIGPEVTPPCLALLDRVLGRVAAGAVELHFEELPAGAGCYRDTGVSLPDHTLARASAADAILLAAMGLPDIRYPDGTEISPQIELRMALNLYAGVRPIRTLPGLGSVLADPRAGAIDLVLIRESTEGLFASHGKGQVEDNRTASDTLVITRDTCERLFDFAFRLALARRARGRPGKVTCVDKANVFTSFAFFRRIFHERATHFPAVTADCAYVDAMALHLVRRPWDLDVLVTENMFGDILSDLGAGLIGGMGLAPSADIGDHHGLFQPAHGSAPDIMGQGIANPTAMILSGAMLLEWLGERHDVVACRRAAALLTAAVDWAFARGAVRPRELGGDAGTLAIAEAVAQGVDELPLPT